MIIIMRQSGEKQGIMLDFSDLVNSVGQEKADCSAIYYFLFRG